MNRKDFLNNINEYKKENDFYKYKIMIPLYLNKELNTTESTVSEKNLIDYLKNNKDLQLEHQILFRKFGLAFNNEDIQNLPYFVTIDWDELEIHQKEIYSVSFNPNKVFDIYALKNNDKKLKTIYRIENENNEGIYHTGIGFRLEIHGDNTPDPSEDGFLKHLFLRDTRDLREFDEKYQKEWLFGFESIKQLQSWFPLDSLEKIQKEKLTINEYLVDENYLVEGNTQVAFKIEHAQLIHQHNISSFLKPQKDKKLKSKIKAL